MIVFGFRLICQVCHQICLLPPAFLRRQTGAKFDAKPCFIPFATLASLGLLKIDSFGVSSSSDIQMPIPNLQKQT
jgi:hypothetical protein